MNEYRRYGNLLLCPVLSITTCGCGFGKADCLLGRPDKYPGSNALASAVESRSRSSTCRLMRIEIAYPLSTRRHSATSHQPCRRIALPEGFRTRDSTQYLSLSWTERIIYRVSTLFWNVRCILRKVENQGRSNLFLFIYFCLPPPGSTCAAGLPRRTWACYIRVFHHVGSRCSKSKNTNLKLVN
jgi:hypothetical protein